jgi:ATP-binding cassette subfamily F protein 3
VLLLDEPTNHLDMESTDAMLAAIDAYDGTVIMVTHNEMFLHALARRLIVFQNNRILVFEGGYQEFLDKIGWQEDEAGRSGRNKENEKSKSGMTKKDQKRLRSEFMANRARTLNPLKNKLKETEKKLELQEKALAGLTQDMQRATGDKNVKEIEKLSKSVFACQSEIDGLYESLWALTEEYESRTAQFEVEMAELDIK